MGIASEPTRSNSRASNPGRAWSVGDIPFEQKTWADSFDLLTRVAAADLLKGAAGVDQNPCGNRVPAELGGKCQGITLLRDPLIRLSGAPFGYSIPEAASGDQGVIVLHDPLTP